MKSWSHPFLTNGWDKKLKAYGSDVSICDWIGSYLEGRSQAVWIDHMLSDFAPVNIGVPQGSNLGPLFFLIFYNDWLTTLNCGVDVYADDSTLSETGDNSEVIGTKLTENCRKVSTWMVSNQFKLNADKTHLLTVGTEQRLRNTTPVQVEMDSVKLVDSADKCEILLGVKIQTNLKWHSQISMLSEKLKTRLVGLAKLKYILPYETRQAVTLRIFNSVLVYCLPVFGGCDKGHIRQLQVQQNKAGQIVAHKSSRVNRNELYDELGWIRASSRNLEQGRLKKLGNLSLKIIGESLTPLYYIFKLEFFQFSIL